MKIGIVYPQTELGGRAEAVRRIGVAVEQLGFDHLTFYDHVVGASHEGREPKLWGPYTDRDPFHDPFVAFGFLAALTRRIELVTGVLILPQRQTVLVAQQSADVDLFSEQRLRLGVGSGWNYVEYDALGQDFTTRGARMDEQIGLLRRLWLEPLVSFEGKFDRVERGNINPRPSRLIPIWIGGFSEPAYRRGGRLGDGFIFGGPLEGRAERGGGVLDGWKRVKHHLAQSGRPDSGYGADWILTAPGDDFVDSIKRWEDAGGTHATLVTMGRGFDTVDKHLDYIADLAARLGLGSR